MNHRDPILQTEPEPGHFSPRSLMSHYCPTQIPIRRFSTEKLTIGGKTETSLLPTVLSAALQTSECSSVLQSGWRRCARMLHSMFCICTDLIRVCTSRCFLIIKPCILNTRNTSRPPINCLSMTLGSSLAYWCLLSLFLPRTFSDNSTLNCFRLLSGFTWSLWETCLQQQHHLSDGLQSFKSLFYCHFTLYIIL